MRLPQKEITDLIALHKQLKLQCEADKVKCIIYWGQGYSWDEIEKILFISRGTIKNYVDKYTEGGIKNLLMLHYQPNNEKLTEEQKTAITNYVEKYSVQKSLQVVKYVKRKFGIIYKTNSMTKLLVRLGFSYKKPKKRPCKASFEKQINFFANYLFHPGLDNKEESIYFVDASGFEHNTHLDYGWIKKGQNKELKSNTGRKRINVNAAYNPVTQEVVSVIQEQNVTTETNIALIEKIIESNPDKETITLILDNASVNKSKALYDYISKQDKKIILWHLPPYCPNLNLIERLWRFVKKKLLANQYFSSYAKFKNRLKDFLENKIKRLGKELKKLMAPNFQFYY